MKKLLLILMLVISPLFISCEKEYCYTCEITTWTNVPYYNQRVDKTAICDMTEDEIAAFQRSRSGVVATSWYNGVSINIYQRTICTKSR